ncbi:SDR family oxidoreductase [Rhodococcus sp. ABRD24]|uniref:SDR family NAD(P)-dependent oxidoreductase n=1 Tax=Rhodococcus sp. ABRD24 TaxID=2507582 RepID=UPI00103A4D20|nr:SDR family oxidoreductase [Rhodococcus sp. ABRD24]QBJ96364.1 SDR family oxidoreductase [Rhodococcus sp. ABRD24]
MARVVVVGGSRGLGRALVDGLSGDGHDVLGVSRRCPGPHYARSWIEADLGDPLIAAETVDRSLTGPVDILIYNIGLWEESAFGPDYRFVEQSDTETMSLIDTNITAAILLLKRLVPRMIGQAQPRVFLTGSTSGLSRSGRPEVAFGASKFALNGIADALREGFRADGLAVTVLQLGYLNTDDGLDVPRETAVARGGGTLIPVHDVVDIVRSIMSLSSASSVRELTLTAIRDERF